MAAAAALAACARALGAAAATILPGGRRLPAAVCALMGLGALSLLGFLACSLGFAPVALPLAVEALPAQPTLARLFALLALVGLRPWAWRRPAWQPRQWPTATALPLVLLAGVAAWALLYSLLPPFLVDESLYHLTLPVQYLRHGGFVVIPGHGNSAFPAFGEMLSLWPLAWGSLSGGRTPQLVVCLLGIWALLDLLPEVRPGLLLWGCLLFFLTPVVLVMLPSSHTDLLQATYGLVAVLCLHRYAQGGDPPLLWAAAWLAGCAAACKYLALALLPLMVLGVLLILQGWQRAGRPLPAAGTLGLAGVLLLAPVAPWLLRNVAIWGNPLFPFATALFPASAHHLDADQLQTLGDFMGQFGPARAGVQLQGLDALLHLPGALLWGAEFNRLTFDGVIGPLGLMVILMALVNGRRPVPPDLRLPPALVVYGLYLVLIWLSTSWQMRFLMPAYWVLCLWAPLLVQRLRGPWARRLGASSLAASLLWVTPPLLGKLQPLDPRMWGDAAAVAALRRERLPAADLCDLAVAASAAAPPLCDDEAPERLMLVWAQGLGLWCDVDLYADSYDEAASFNRWLDAPELATSVSLFAAHRIRWVLIDEEFFLAQPPALPAAAAARLAGQERRYRLLTATWQLLGRRGRSVLYALPALAPGAEGRWGCRGTPPARLTIGPRRSRAWSRPSG